MNAIAPPMSTWSQRSRSALITPSLSPTLAPPSTATNGRATSSASSRDSTSTSRNSNRPPACGITGGGPTIDAWARCDAPNASFT